jgi:hypothetical protein
MILARLLLKPGGISLLLRRSVKSIGSLPLTRSVTDATHRFYFP